jgi:cytochrome c
MDSFEINKLIGAFLATVFVIFTVTLASDALFAAHAPEKPGYIIEAAEGEAEGGGEAAPVEDIAAQVLPLIATANPDAGANTFKKCQACHDGTKGGPNKVGPNLWGVVDRPIASHEGFSYSSAMKEFSEGGQKHWTFENLAHFLHGPKAFVPGTAMAFAGVKKPQDEADLLAFLRTLADSPASLPEAAPAEEKSAAAPAEGAAPAGGAAPAEGAAPPEGAAPAENAAPAADQPAGGTQQPAEGAAPAEGQAAPAND